MKKISLLFIFINFSFLIFAGDVANFMNLGFSTDGKYFLFGEYGITSDLQKVYSNIWLVDIEKNSFVSNGVYSGEYKTVIEPGESPIGGLLKLLQKADVQINKYKIDYLEQGRPLYIRINDDNNVNVLNFRDFMTGLTYEFELIKKEKKEGAKTSSSFGINLKTIDKNNRIRTYKLGNPNYQRSNVIDYKIERILHGSKDGSIVVVVSKYIKDGDSTNIRYMVETISLN